MAAEVSAEVALRLPAPGGPAAGRPDPALRSAVESALAHFLDLVAGRRTAARSEDCTAFGRRQAAAGRSPEAVQAACRAGGRAAWRRLAAVARRTGVGPDATAALAEAVFAHVDEVTATALQGHRRPVEARRPGGPPQTAARAAGRRAPGPRLVAAAELAQWRLPATVAFALLAPGEDLAGARLGLPADVLCDLRPPYPCILLPDPAELRNDGRVRQLLG
ncbi:hypothetical protein ACFQ1I_43600 [Kitasatospora arboriphila]